MKEILQVAREVAVEAAVAAGDAGVLLAQEAGAIVIDFEGQPFERMNPEPYLIACHLEQRETFLEIIRQGLCE